MTAQPNCEARIAEHMASTLEDLGQLWNLYKRGIDDENDWARLDVRERAEICEDLGISIFAARREEMPNQITDLGTFHEYGLAFDYVPAGTFTDQDQGYFRYQISWGGPSEEFRFYVDADLSCYCVEFWFLDWGDGASRELRYEGGRELMMEIWDFFKETGTVEAELEKASE